MQTIVKYKGIIFDVEYSHQPEEVESWGHHGGHPHIHESVEIEEIKHAGESFLEILENDFEAIEKLILKENHGK